ncbi:UNVERIFIED_CONTAM: stage II sporulation protein D [Acetivibrio alkalicellulosi]
MSRDNLKKKALVLAIILVIVNMNIILGKSMNLPNEVRIGLNFNDTQTNQYTALSSFEIDCKEGMELGYFKDNKFNSLYTSKNTLTIKKGENYHIKIGGNYIDYSALDIELQAIKQQGINAYPVYADGWQIWEGFYSTEEEAKEAILSLSYGNGLNVVETSTTRIIALTENQQVALVFDSLEGVFQVRPSTDNSPSVFRINRDDKRRYRGILEVRRFTGSDMTLINVLSLEHYLYGVVPYEIQASSHPEALKAQAVAARTYSVSNMQKYIRLNFNLCTTVYSQVYRGYDGEATSTNKAIDDTKGEIVTFNGRPAAVFYFSSSGGRTEDVRNVWGSENFPYLISVEDKYESGNSWRYNWKVSYTAQRIKEIMLQRGFDLGDIIGVNITKRSDAGRATELVVMGTKGERVYTNSGTRAFLSLDSQWFDISTDADILVKFSDDTVSKTQLAGAKVMTASGIQTIGSGKKEINVVSGQNKKSTIPLAPTIYTFTGRGWGHGVGMSQEGAKGLANAGYKYKEILEHYFPGTKVE